MVSVWPLEPSSPVPVGRGGIVGLSEKSGYLDYQKKINTIFLYRFKLIFLGNLVLHSGTIECLCRWFTCP